VALVPTRLEGRTHKLAKRYGACQRIGLPTRDIYSMRRVLVLLDTLRSSPAFFAAYRYLKVSRAGASLLRSCPGGRN